MPIRIPHIALCVGLSMLAFIGCASATPAATPTSASPQAVSVKLTSYKLDLSTTAIKPGEAKFTAQNVTTDTVHEFFLVKTDLAPDKLPVDQEGKVSEDATTFTKVGSAEDIGEGKSGDFTATLAPGHYVYFCNIDTHYSLGMRGEFTVAP